MVGGFNTTKKTLVSFAFFFSFACAYAADDPVVATKGYVDTVVSTNSATLAANIASAVQTISTLQPTSDKTTAISSTSTDAQYPSAKAVYTLTQNYQPTSAKTVTVNSASTDAQYPSAKAVYTLTQGYQPTTDKTTAISATSTDVQYPSAKAVYTMVQNDPRFNSLPTTAPTGNPPAGRFYIWIEN
jgi:hypothetical protein